ncbi:MAG: hypothetical protein EP318_10615 [Rhodobacteraceae bacterium]|nr:MAG: hypothetical protein EP318_10615 [Paracoccaceae bacterium]
MKRLVLTAACIAALATAGIADQSKSAMSAKEIERQTVISTQGALGSAESSGAMVVMWVFTVLIMAAAAASGGGSNHVPHTH